MLFRSKDTDFSVSIISLITLVATFYVISLFRHFAISSFRHFAISSFRHFAISCFKHALFKQQRPSFVDRIDLYQSLSDPDIESGKCADIIKTQA